MGEFGLIRHLTKDIGIKNAETLKGVGDDCAVLQYSTGRQVLVTTDLLMEGVHFDLQYVPLKHLGYKSAMVNLSDIYAMNGHPRQMTVSLAVSKRFKVEDLEAFYAGLRRSEICGLKWSDVDFAAETLTVRRVRERYVEGAPLNEYTHIIDMPGKPQIERESTKSGHIRTFIVPHELIEILKSEQQSQRINRLKWGQKYFTSDYVCVASDGAPVSANGLSKCMRGVCRLHDLRHLNVTYQIDAGIPIPEIARRAGHTNSQTTMKVYAHALTKQDKTAADALSRALGALK